MIKTDIKIAGKHLCFSYADNQFYVRKPHRSHGVRTFTSPHGGKLHFQEILDFISHSPVNHDKYLRQIVGYPKTNLTFAAAAAWGKLQSKATEKLNRKSHNPTHPLKGSPNTWDRANDAKTTPHLSNWSASAVEYQNYWAIETWDRMQRESNRFSDEYIAELLKDAPSSTFRRLEYETHLPSYPCRVRDIFQVSELWKKRCATEETRNSKIKRLAKMDSNSEEFRKLWKTCL